MHVELEYWIIDFPSDFIGWEILGITDHKEGVKLIHMRKVTTNGAELLVVHCKAEIIKEYLESQDKQNRELLESCQ